MSDIYKGVALPWDGTLRGFIEPKDDYDVLRSSIYWILMTSPGERVMMPEFGTPLKRMLFDPNDDVFSSSVVSEIQQAISQWDDRLQILELSIKRTDDGHGVEVKILFKNKKDPLQETRTLEYIIEEE